MGVKLGEMIFKSDLNEKMSAWDERHFSALRIPKEKPRKTELNETASIPRTIFMLEGNLLPKAIKEIK